MSLRRKKRRKNSYDIAEPRPLGKWAVRLVLLAGFLLFLLLVGLYFGAGIYLRSESFRALAEEAAQKKLQADVTLSPFNWEGKTVHIASFQAEKGHLKALGDSLYLSKLQIEGLQAHFNYNHLLEREVFCPQLSAQKVEIFLDSSAKAGNLSPQLGSELSPAPPSEPPSLFSPDTGLKPETSSPSQAWYKDLLPQSFSFGSIEIPQLDIKYQATDGTFCLQDAQVKITQESTKKNYKLSLHKGTLTQPFSYFPTTHLESLQLRSTPKEVFLQELKGSFPTGGRIALEGNWLLEEKSGALQISLTDIPLEQLISPRWIRSIKGTLKTTSTLTQSPEKPLYLKGQVSLNQAVLTALPVLDTLAAFTQTTRFRQLHWEKAEASYTYEKNALHIQDIILNSEGLLRIEGHLSFQGEYLSGTLFVGIPASLLRRLPLEENAVFSAETYEGKYGYKWAKVTLSGTKSAPKEDLSAQLLSAAGDRLFSLLPDQGGKVLDFTRSAAERLLNTPSKENSETGSDSEKKDNQPPVKMGEDLLKSALEQGLDLFR